MVIFCDKIKSIIESKDSKIYFCNKFMICRLNMYFKVLLYFLRYIKFFMLNTKFCYKNGILPFNFNSKFNVKPYFPTKY